MPTGTTPSFVSVTASIVTHRRGFQSEWCVLHDDRPIGAMGFLKHDYTQHKAELRKLIGDPDLRGQGYAREATRLWIQYGLQGMGLKKIYLNTLETNLRNIRLNEELGFKVEGILRNEVMIDGRTHDVVRMGLLSPDEPADTSDSPESA